MIPTIETRNRVWILAHPDDEIFALALFFEPNYKNIIIFLTNANISKTSNFADKNYGTVGLPKQELNLKFVFVGDQFKFEPRQIANSMNLSKLHSLFALVRSHEPQELITTKYEGGHIDHDVSNLVARFIGLKLDIKVKAYSTYRSYYGVHKLHSVMSRDAQDKNIDHDRLKVSKMALVTMFYYRKALKTWLVMGLRIIFKYLFRRKFYFQELSSLTLDELNKKHVEVVLYEKMKRNSHLELGTIVRILKNQLEFYD